MSQSQRKNIMQPADWWAAFETRAKKDGKNLSEWIGEQCLVGLTQRERAKLSERPSRGPVAKGEGK